MATRHISHLKSSGTTQMTVSGKTFTAAAHPSSSEIYLGEIAVNYAENYETLFIKNSAGKIIPFANWLTTYKYINDQVASAGKIKSVTGTSPISAFTNNETGVVTISHVTAGTAATSDLYKVAVDQYGHVTGYTRATKADIPGMGDKLETSAFTSYSAETKTLIDGKANSAHTHTTSDVTDLQTKLDGKVNTSVTITTASGLTGGGNLSADRTIGLATVGTSGTFNTVKVDEYGRVTSGSMTTTTYKTVHGQAITGGTGNIKSVTAVTASADDGLTATTTTADTGDSVNVTVASGYKIPTTGETSAWTEAYKFVSGITGTDADDVINKWDEVVRFLSGISDSGDTLEQLLSAATSGEISAVTMNYAADTKTLTWTGTKKGGTTVTGSTTIPEATASAAGLMPASAVTKLNGISSGANKTEVSQTLTSGTKIGTITIDGTATDLYCETDTDTHYTATTVVANSSTGKANAAATDGSVYLNQVENDTVTSSHNIKGAGAVSVTSDANGVITISAATESAKQDLTVIGGATTAATYNTSSAKSVTFTGGTGIEVTATTAGTITITNTGITSVTTSNTNGNISVNGSDVAVHGLQDAAYMTSAGTTGTSTTAVMTQKATTDAINAAKVQVKVTNTGNDQTKEGLTVEPTTSGSTEYTINLGDIICGDY